MRKSSRLILPLSKNNFLAFVDGNNERRWLFFDVVIEVCRCSLLGERLSHRAECCCFTFDRPRESARAVVILRARRIS